MNVIINGDMEIGKTRTISKISELKELIDELYEAFYEEKLYRDIKEIVKDEVKSEIDSEVCTETGYNDLDELYEGYREQSQAVQDIKDIVRYM